MASRRYTSREHGSGTVMLMALGAIAVAIALYIGILALGAAILSWGWNLVVPSVFSGPTLDFGAAFALLVVLAVIRSFLFGGGGQQKS